MAELKKQAQVAVQVNEFLFNLLTLRDDTA